MVAAVVPVVRRVLPAVGAALGRARKHVLSRLWEWMGGSIWENQVYGKHRLLIDCGWTIVGMD